MLTTLFIISAVSLALLFFVLIKLSKAQNNDYSSLIEKALKEENKNQREELQNTFSRFERSIKDDIERSEIRQKSDFENFDRLLKEKFNEMAKYQNENNERVVKSIKETSETVEKRLVEIRTDNEKKLEQMRLTVDEKLHETLEKRLSESFQRVSEQLENIAKTAGEMKVLASDVGDLKKVLSNVKIRGTWGEYQLGNILEQIFTPSQYDVNVATKPQSSERVEFAIKLPGKNLDDPNSFIYLPIDSKFPIEDYQRLIVASEEGNVENIALTRKSLLAALKKSAKDISDKYISAPHTTDFALMFLPVEGLYAEALREPGVFEDLQRNYKVTIVGPTTLSALLSSLQMGFRTLAIEKKSAVVWETLAAVKTEFNKFGYALDKVQSQISTAKKSIDELKGTRLTAMDRRLRGLETLDEQKAVDILGIDESAHFPEED